MKKKEICTVIRQKEIGDGIFSMWIQTENIGHIVAADRWKNLL